MTFDCGKSEDCFGANIISYTMTMANTGVKWCHNASYTEVRRKTDTEFPIRFWHHFGHGFTHTLYARAHVFLPSTLSRIDNNEPIGLKPKEKKFYPFRL